MRQEAATNEHHRALYLPRNRASTRNGNHPVKCPVAFASRRSRVRSGLAPFFWSANKPPLARVPSFESLTASVVGDGPLDRTLFRGILEPWQSLRRNGSSRPQTLCQPADVSAQRN